MMSMRISPCDGKAALVTRNLQFVYDGNEPQRLDKYLAVWVTELSRSRLQNLIRDGFVRVNDKQAVKTGQTIISGDQIEVIIPPAVPTDFNRPGYPARYRL